MDVFKKAFLAGLGALSLSRDRAKVMVDELVAQGKLREQEGRKLVEDMMKKASAARQDIEKTINQQMTTAYGKLNVATQDQLKKMEKRLKDLEKELKKKNAGSRTRSASSK